MDCNKYKIVHFENSYMKQNISNKELIKHTISRLV